jgi:hypothetical protein
MTWLTDVQVQFLYALWRDFVSDPTLLAGL